MLGHGPVMQAGPYEGYTFEDVLEQDPLAVLEYMDKYGYDDPELRARAKAALESAEDESDFSFSGFDSSKEDYYSE